MKINNYAPRRVKHRRRHYEKIVFIDYRRKTHRIRHNCTQSKTYQNVVGTQINKPVMENSSYITVPLWYCIVKLCTFAHHLRRYYIK